MNCPICNIQLSNQRTCPQCGKEWLSQNIAGEEVLTSKPHVVELISELEEEKLLDDCIKPIPVRTFSFTDRGVEGLNDREATFSTPEELRELCPLLGEIRRGDLSHLVAMKILLDDSSTITIQRDDFEGDI